MDFFKKSDVDEYNDLLREYNDLLREVGRLRVEVDAHLCCKPAWYDAHGGAPSQDALTEASWKRCSGVHFAEENMRVRVKLADNGGEHRREETK